MKGFEEVIKKFPKCAEGYALYAQVTVIFPIFSVAKPFLKNCICVLNPSMEIRKQGFPGCSFCRSRWLCFSFDFLGSQDGPESPPEQLLCHTIENCGPELLTGEA